MRVLVRRTAKSRGPQHCEADVGFPGDEVGSSSEGEVGRAEGAEGDGGRAGELREPFGHARSTRPVTVFIPPAIFDEEQTVFDLPMGAHGCQEFARGDAVGIEAGEKIARVG